MRLFSRLLFLENEQTKQSCIWKTIGNVIIGCWGFFPFHLRGALLTFFVGIIGCPGMFSEHLMPPRASNLGLNYLICILAGCTLNVQPTNLHKKFFPTQSSSCYSCLIVQISLIKVTVVKFKIVKRQHKTQCQKIACKHEIIMSLL